MKSTKESYFPSGWDQRRVAAVLDHYERQSEDEAAAEDEAVRSGRGSAYAAALHAAIERYDFPTVTYDFKKEEEVPHADMPAVEMSVRELLRAPDRCDVKDGLSNVLYWGYMNSPGRRDFRVKRFRGNVTDDHLDTFMKIARGTPRPGPIDIRQIGLPEFSGMSFVTKILMFLDPAGRPVLDMKIAEAFSQSPDFPPLQALAFRRKADFGRNADTQVKITGNNARVYDEWAAWCTRIAAWANAEPASPCRGIRAVDVERAVFTLAESPDRAAAWRLLRGPGASRELTSRLGRRRRPSTSSIHRSRSNR